MHIFPFWCIGNWVRIGFLSNIRRIVMINSTKWQLHPIWMLSGNATAPMRGIEFRFESEHVFFFSNSRFIFMSVNVDPGLANTARRHVKTSEGVNRIAYSVCRKTRGIRSHALGIYPFGFKRIFLFTKFNWNLVSVTRYFTIIFKLAYP